MGGQAQFNMTAPGGSNPAGVNAVTVTINDMAVFNIGNSTPPTPSVQTAGSKRIMSRVTLAKTTLLQSVSGGLAFNSTVDGPQSLSLVSGPGGVAFAATVGGTMPLKSINVSTTGLVQLAPGASLNLQWRRGKRGVQYPAHLASQSPKPVPAADRRRYHTDCHGNHRRQSSPFPTDHLETGANFHVTVAWSDGVTVDNPSSVVISAGDTVTLIVNQSGSIQQWIVKPGTGQGPIARRSARFFFRVSGKVVCSGDGHGHGSHRPVDQPQGLANERFIQLGANYGKRFHDRRGQ